MHSMETRQKSSKIGKILFVLILIFGLFMAVYILSFIFSSFTKINSITKDQALEKVGNISEVIDYEKNLEQNNATAEFNVEDWNTEWGIQVFENVKDGTSSHTATYNWYTVNKTTGAVSKQ